MTATSLEDAAKLATMYTTLPEAILELERRRRDPELQKKVREFLDGHDHRINTDPEPYFCYTRHITSANFEFDILWNMVKEHTDYKLYLLEGSTKFVTQNMEKYFLAKMFFCKPSPPGIDTSDRQALDTYKTCDFNSWNGKPMHDIRMDTGELLVDFHHRILFDEYPETRDRIEFVEHYEWLLEARKKYDHRYTAFFASFIMHGILFENNDFLSSEEDIIIHNEIIPSYESIYKHFGLKPLIVSIVDISIAHSDYWLWYNWSIREKYNLMSPNSVTHKNRALLS